MHATVRKTKLQRDCSVGD